MNIPNYGLQTTYNRIYILRNDNGEYMNFQFMPDSYKRDRTAKQEDIEIIGFNNPKYQYAGGDTKLSISLRFTADESSRKSVLGRIRWLEALTMNDNGNRPAPTVSLIFGSMSPRNNYEVWVVESVSSELTRYAAEYDMLPVDAKVELTFCLAPTTNTSWEQVSPAFTPGRKDGEQPLDLGTAPDYSDDNEKNKWIDTTGKNDLQSILRRALDRLRIV